MATDKIFEERGADRRHSVDLGQVVHPAHYNSHPSGVECIVIIQEFPLNIGTAVKYLWRAGLKNDNSYAQDLLKAQEYIDFELIRLGVKTSMPPVAEPNTATTALRKGIPQHFLHYKGEVVHFHGELPDEIKDYLEQQSAGTSVVSDVSEGGVVTFDILPDDNYNSLAKGYDEDGKCKRSCCNPQV